MELVSDPYLVSQLPFRQQQHSNIVILRMIPSIRSGRQSASNVLVHSIARAVRHAAALIADGKHGYK